MRYPMGASDFKFESIQGVIFDLDGTLAHSNPDFCGLRRELGVSEGSDVLAHVDSLSEAWAREQALAIIHQYECRASHSARWVDGARELIAFLRARALPMAILTRNIPEAAQLTISKLGIDIDLVLTRHDARPKPHPEGIERICAQWQLAPANILYVGDYLFDLQTAQNAGSRCALYVPDTVPDYAHEADLLVTCYHGFIDAWGRSDGRMQKG